ncbi:MAG: 50S ribosomal protein L30e [Candidatus Methanosuratincola sp.]
MDIVKELKTAIKTGKVETGYRVALKLFSKKKVKALVLASNAPEEVASKVRAVAGEGTPIYRFPGSSWELGGLCGKPFPVSTVSVIEPGESSILKQEGE